ncbi:MAG: hypothetical protein LBB76_12830, partial [Azoarcus sp.]|nr:hypothetical protein [Azoarcus sp.]
MKTPSPSFPFHTLTYAVAMAFSAHAGALEISQVPLIAGSSVPANLMYIHDDSGSMETGYLPDSIGPLHNIYTVRQTGVNKQYYSPGASYKAPPFTDNAHLDPNGANSNFNSAW